MEVVIPWVIALIAVSWLAVLYIRAKRVRVDGYIVITKNEEGKKTFLLELEGDPDELEAKNRIIFKVTDSPREDLD